MRRVRNIERAALKVGMRLNGVEWAFNLPLSRLVRYFTWLEA
ncbi:hypothetical protein [Leminorella richardii]|nr:hypothetical protein [Leminorella richardii]